MTVIDASVWLTAHRRHEQYHAKTAEWLDQMYSANRNIAIPTIFLTEIAGVLARTGATRDPLLQITSAIHQNPSIAIHAVDFVLTERSIIVISATRLKGSDAIYVALASVLNMPLVSWDQKHLSRSMDLIKVMTPVQALEQMAT